MKGISFSHRFDDRDENPTNNAITIEHGNGESDTLYLTNVVAVKVCTMKTDGTIDTWAVLTREDKVTCLYRIEDDRVVVEQYKKYLNHWAAGYNAFVRSGGWQGNMEGNPAPAVTTVIRVLD